MVFTADTYTGPTAKCTHWWLIKRSGGVKTLVRSGSIDVGVSIEFTSGIFGIGSLTGLWACCLEDDLTHVWMAYGAGVRDVFMLRVTNANVLEFASKLDSGAGVPGGSYS